MGYHARVTQKSADGGVDIIAHKDELGFEEPIIKVQCKQTLSVVGQPAVAQLYGHVGNREKGLFVTLGDYTSQARQFDANQPHLESFRFILGKWIGFDALPATGCPFQSHQTHAILR